jgi:AraC-like DNA-binding protein
MEPGQLHNLIQTLQALQVDWDRVHYGYSHSGFETRKVSSEYQWYGLKRIENAANPCILFQYTVEGWGYFVDGKVPYRVTPGMLFTAVIPSDHRYYLPPESSHWMFFWVMVRHPYIVSRIAQKGQRVNRVVSIAPTATLIEQMLSTLRGFFSGGFRDVFEEERALFNLLIEYERFWDRLEHSDGEREQLLTNVRAYVRQFLSRSVQIAELAEVYGMTRSNFSHHFKAVTGLTPASFMMQVRLDEVTRLLLQSELKLESIANSTGFASANHLCRVFRLRFSLSPGEFRRQMRSR